MSFTIDKKSLGKIKDNSIQYVISFSSNFSQSGSKKINVRSSKYAMPIQAPSWTEFLICPVCTHEFVTNLRVPITLGCGHTICKSCLATLHRKQCPFDQTNITKDLDNLPINYALLQLVTSSSSSNNAVEHEILPIIVQTLNPDELKCYEIATQCVEELALYLKPSGNISGLLSRPMQRKLVTLINCQLIEDEGRSRSLRAARSLGERTVTELILQHQNPQQLSQNLWAAVRARGCQFLGPAMQEEVLKLVLLALEDGSPLSRKILVLYVVSKLLTTFPQASKTSIGHVVQLLYRASCFKVSKRDGDSSLMTLKEEFRTYEALRREHDTQIVQIATEAGLRIAPDQWSALLYGDNIHKSHMQSIIDKQQSPSSFAQSVNELVLALQRTGDPANLSRLRSNMDNLANIDASTEANIIPAWNECSNALEAVKQVVIGLIDFIQHHGNRKMPETSYLTHTSRYKVSFCREFQTKGNCMRGQNCNFAHSEEELDRYRAKFKKNAMRNAVVSTSHNNNNPMKDVTNYSVSNGPNSKVNMNHHHPTYAKNQDSSSSRFNKSTPYRSENSLHHTTMSSSSHHLKPTTNVYSNASSTSTPNLSLQLSPNQQKNGPRFAYGNGVVHNSNNHNNNNNNNNGSSFSPNYVEHSNASMMNQGKIMNYNHRPPPFSAPPIPQSNNYLKSPTSSGYSSDYGKKQLSPYHGHHSNNNVNNNNVPIMTSPTHFQKHHASPTYHHNNNNNAGYYNMQQQQTQPQTSNFFNNNTRNCSVGDEAFGDPKYMQWNYKQQKSPQNMNNLMPKSPNSQPISKSANTSPNNRINEVSTMQDYGGKRNGNRMHMNIPPLPNLLQQQQQHQQNTIKDEVDGISNMWKYQPPQYQQPTQIMKTSSSFQFTPGTTTTSNMSKDKFIRSDSILTSNTDDSYDNLPTNGKYGAIGINKNIEAANQWSGLQQSVPSRFDSTFDISSGDIGAACAALELKSSNKQQQKDEGHLRIVGNGNNLNLNGNFLNMPIGDINIPSTSSSSTSNLWSDAVPNWNSNNNNNNNNGNQESSKKDYDIDAFGNDVDVWTNFWDIINE